MAQPSNNHHADTLLALESIAGQCGRIDDFLVSRLPTQRKVVQVDVAAKKWLLASVWKEKHHDDQVLASLRTSKTKLGQFRSRVLDQGEALTKLLVQLDGIESNGDDAIRRERKSVVTEIQRLLVVADAMASKCADFVRFAHDHVYYVLTPPPQADSPGPSEPTMSPSIKSSDDSLAAAAAFFNAVMSPSPSTYLAMAHYLAQVSAETLPTSERVDAPNAQDKAQHQRASTGEEGCTKVIDGNTTHVFIQTHKPHHPSLRPPHLQQPRTFHRAPRSLPLWHHHMHEAPRCCSPNMSSFQPVVVVM